MTSSSPYDSGWIPGSGIPVAPPVGPPRISDNAQVSAEFGDLRGTNTPVTPSPPSRPGTRPVSRKALAKLEDVMPVRDRRVVEHIAEHRFLSTHQIKRFVFTSHTTDEAAIRTARVVLTRLERAGLIRSLGRRRVGGVRAGSTAKIWQLAPAGARLLRDDGMNYRTHEPSSRFLAHCLAVADVHLSALDLLQLPSVESVHVQTEPSAWRRYVGAAGERLWLQPDLAVIVATVDYVDRWFIEVDLGTESLPTLLKKCGRYEAYRSTGAETGEHDAFPLVLFLFSSAHRARRLQEAIDHSRRLTPQLYRVTTPTQLAELLQRGGV